MVWEVQRLSQPQRLMLGKLVSNSRVWRDLTIFQALTGEGGAPSVPRRLCNATTPVSCHPPMRWVPASPQAGGWERDFKVTQPCPWPPGASSPGEERVNANTSDSGGEKHQVKVMWKKSPFLRLEMLALPKKKKRQRRGEVRLQRSQRQHQTGFRVNTRVAG